MFSDWVKAAREKDFDTLADIQKKVDRMMDILWIYSPFLSTTKAVLVDQGIFAKDLMTFPYLPFPEAKKQELRNFIREFE
jgi:dihydrodipicolinate synthase/N-acetylneuraminate lyase